MLTACIDHGRGGDKQGYAQTHGTRLHRKVYAAKMGLTLEQIKGVTVRHTCDNTRCINPDHLIGGTMLDNARDRVERGRSAKTQPSRWKLTEEQCRAILRRFSPRRVGLTAPDGITQIARDYDVDRNVIRQVLNLTYPGWKS